MFLIALSSCGYTITWMWGCLAELPCDGAGWVEYWHTLHKTAVALKTVHVCPSWNTFLFVLNACQLDQEMTLPPQEVWCVSDIKHSGNVTAPSLLRCFMIFLFQERRIHILKSILLCFQRKDFPFPPNHILSEAKLDYCLFFRDFSD